MIRRRRAGRRLRQASVSAILGTALLLGGCATTSEDFVRQGELFLESDDMARAAGYRLVGARCTAPSSVAVGTRYPCIATDERGYAWVFELEITGARELTVQDVAPAPGSTWNR